jgi:uncharacterized protein (DUF2062 family)
MNIAAMSHSSFAERCHHFWRERVLGLLVAQLKQGISPEKIALTISIGICLSAFPILGTTSLLCLVIGVCLGLNQPVIQLVNWLGSPLQLGLFPAFVRLGEWLTRAQRVSFSIPELFAKFRQSPVAFFKEFGLTGWHGIVGWAVTIPFAFLILYSAILPLTKKLHRAYAK